MPKKSSGPAAGRKGQAVWGGRFRENPAELMIRFSESVSFDKRLAPYDVRCSKAHAAMLCHVGLISKKDRAAINKGLDAILADIEAGKFHWNSKLEDVHMNIERSLALRTPSAGKLHTGRSRNDQVATDMRLFFKDSCEKILASLKEVMAILVKQAEKHQEIYVPGYTHLQRAQPVSIAHHFLAYVEMFDRDRGRFQTVHDHANVCPLGSGAIAGTTLPIDREFTAVQLGFVNKNGRPLLTQNSMDAVADRDLFIEFAAACALCGTHFSRVSEDLILWNTTEFGFVDLPKAFCTGSSLMPQKKNPDALELLRGKAARLQGNLQTLLSLVKGLPLTYNRDLQEDKPPVFDAADQTLICLQVLGAVLAGTKFNRRACAAAAADPNLLATDLADYLVERGVPFRKAHHTVGALVALAEKNKTTLDKLPLEAAQKIEKSLGKDWRKVFDLSAAMKKRNRTGMPGPLQVKRQLARWKKELALR